MSEVAATDLEADLDQEPEAPVSLTLHELECLGQLRCASGRVQYKGENFSVSLDFDGRNYRFIGESSGRMVSFVYDLVAQSFVFLQGAEVEWLKAFVKGNKILDD